MKLRIFARSLVAALLTLLAADVYAQGVVRLPSKTKTGTLSSTTGAASEVILHVSAPTGSTALGGFGQVKIQTLDSYIGDWEVQCAPNGTTYDEDSELTLKKVDASSTVLSVSDTVGIWEVTNAGGCTAIKVKATGGFSGADTAVVITAYGSGGGSGGGSSGGGGGGDFDIASFQTAFGTGAVFLSTGADNVANTQDHLPAFNYVFDGTTWDRWTGAVTATVTDGSGALNVIIDSSASLTVTDGSGAMNVICDSGCAGGTQYAEDAVHASGNTGTLALVVRNDAGTALAADGDNIPLMVNSAGALFTQSTVTDGSGALNVIVDSSATLTVTDGAGAMNVIVDSATLGTVTVSDGSGALNVIVDSSATLTVTDGSGAMNVICDSGCSGGAQYTEGDTDASITGPAILFEDADTLVAATGTAANGLDVDVTRVGGTVTVSDGAGAMNVIIDSSAALTVGDGSGALNVICDSGCAGGTQYAEDAVHASGNTGTLALVVRNDAGTALAADGDNIPLMVDSAGKLFTNATITDGSGALNVIVDSSATLTVTDGSGALNVICDSGCSGGTQYTHDAALTIGSTVGTMAMGRSSAAAPTSVSADDDAVLAWYLRNGAQATVITAAGALIGGDATNGLDVDVTRLPALVAGTANIGDVDVLTIAAGDNNIGNMDVVTLPALVAGTANIGDVDVRVAVGGTSTAVTGPTEGSITAMHVVIVDPVTDAAAVLAGACTPGQLVTDGTDELEIKDTGGYLDYMNVFSINTAVPYVRLYDLDADDTDENDTPVNTVAVPLNGTATNGAGSNNMIPGGMAFSNAITIRVNEGIATNSTTAVDGATVVVSYCYR